MSEAKPFLIAKWSVMNAWQKVRANAGSHGIDYQTIQQFEENLKDNLYKLWNRLSSGSYFPPPVRAVENPKSNGKMRLLGIPTVSDRIAQTIIRDKLNPVVEPIFCEDSYAYRQKKSALDAVETVKRRSWKYNWVLELPSKGRLIISTMKAVKFHTDCRWTILYVERWLKAPLQDNFGKLTQRSKGTPQGGVVSPLLFNLYFHYAFDAWMQRRFPSVPFVRYADDGLLHCISQSQAQTLLNSLGERMREYGCELNLEKTKIVYCRDENRRGNAENIQFDFLGFNFRGRLVKARNGIYFCSFSASISHKSKDKILAAIRSWDVGRWTDATLVTIGEKVNSKVRGWWSYYGVQSPSNFKRILSHLNRILVRWASRKYKRFKGSRRKASDWLKLVSTQSPSLFHHWTIGVTDFS